MMNVSWRIFVLKFFKVIFFFVFFEIVICRVKDVTKCEGEASANNRKAKLIFFYEWTLQAEWEGILF
jgi:hypothetical protein